MRLLALVPWLMSGLLAGACVTVAPAALAQDKGATPKEPDAAKEPPKEGETPPAEGDKPKEKEKEEDKLGGWGVGGTEGEGAFKPKGKTGKLKELEKDEEDVRARDQAPIDIGPPGFAWLDFANTPSGTIVVPMQPSGPNTIKPGASFLIGIGYRIKKKWEISARFGVSTAATQGKREPIIPGARDPDNYKQIATGNVEIGFRPFFQLTQSVVLPVGLALTIPTAMGDMFANPDNQTDRAQAIVNQAAAAMRGWEDRALWEPRRFGITPSVAVMWQRDLGPGKLKVQGRTKVEIMVLTGGNDPTADPNNNGQGTLKDVAVSWLLGAGAGYALFDGLLEPELKLWFVFASPTHTFGSADISGGQFVFEPNVRTHVPFNKDKTIGLDGRFGFTLPAGGPLGSNKIFTPNNTSIWGLRVTAGLFF